MKDRSVTRSAVMVRVTNRTDMRQLRGITSQGATHAKDGGKRPVLLPETNNKQNIMKRIGLSAVPEVLSKIEQNYDVFTITDKFRNLSLKDSSASSSNHSFVSTLTPTASLLERFKIRTNPSAFTRNVIEMTKAPFFDIKNPIINLTEKANNYMMSIGFRFMPGQGEFLIKDLRAPDTLVGLRKLKDSLGLSLTKGSLNSNPLLKLKGISDSVSNSMESLASRVLVEVITFNEGYYGRFLILVQMGIGCTVWYGFVPGDGINMPIEGLNTLFSPIENYDTIFTNPDAHVIPGFNKMTLIEGVNNPAASLSQAFAQDRPFMDMDIEIPDSNKSIIIGVSLGLAVAILFTFGINPCCGEVIV